MKSIRTLSLFLAGAVVAGVALMSLRPSPSLRPEMPQMLSFVSTPRFDHTIDVFGQKIDLSRYDRHERFEREMTNMCYAHTNTLLVIKRANRLFPIIEPILREEGIPDDMKYLCCIESSLNQRAVSPAKAAGLWQFIAETGRRYGLQIDTEVDERYSIEKSTRAACKYFREAYEKFGDWNSVAASYNAGQAGISRRLKDQDATTALDLLLVEETSRYMFRIMAMKTIMSDPYRYGFVIYSDQLYRPIRTSEVTVKQSITDITAFAKKHGCSYFHLKEFNPWLRDSKLTVRPGKQYTLLIPEKDDMQYDGQPFKVHNKAWIVDK
ncbi:MAG: lytic transglycosylase domain-containing protein [Bacteroidales bacterium]|nr:lytic transglycosylase domain-containing protein [Candidatus Liminaster caballi]